MRLTWNPEIFSELRLVYNKNTYYRDGSLMLLRVRDKRGHAHMYRYHVDLFFPTAAREMRKTKHNGDSQRSVNTSLIAEHPKDFTQMRAVLPNLSTDIYICISFLAFLIN